MFRKPIRHVPLRTMEEVKACSYELGESSSDDRGSYTYQSLENHSTAIIYCDECNQLFITPFRRDIEQILIDQKYRNVHDRFYKMLFYPNNIIPAEYQWLEWIAKEENWALTYEEAFRFSQEKDIKPVTILEPICRLNQIIEAPLVNEIPGKIETCRPMISLLFETGTLENVGTYIHLSSRSLLVCDEYGRTFYIAVNGVINDIENLLISSGYTRTKHPERYVSYDQMGDTHTPNTTF